MLDDDARNAALTRIGDDTVIVANAAIRVFGVCLRILCFDTTIRKPQCHKLVQDLLTQFLTSRMRILVIATIVGIPDFRAMCTCSSRINMDAHEYGRTLLSCTTNTLDKTECFILRTGHIHAYILIVLKFSLACLRDLPGNI